MPMPIYRLETRSRDDGTLLNSSLPFEALSFSYALNGPGGIDFTMSMFEAAPNMLTQANALGRSFTTNLGAILTETDNTADPDGGTAATRWQTSGGTGTVKLQTASIGAAIVGVRYTISLWIKVRAGSTAGVTVQGLAGAFPGTQTFPNDGNWYQFTGSFVATTTNAVEIRFGAAVGDNLDFDVYHLQIEKAGDLTPASWRPGSGGSPILDPGNTVIKLFRTSANLIVGFDGSWDDAAVHLLAAGTTAPTVSFDGGASPPSPAGGAGKAVWNATGNFAVGSARLGTAQNFLPGETRTWSVWLKASTNMTIHLLITGSAGFTDLTVSLTTSWQRFSVTAKNTTGSTQSAALYQYSPSTTATTWATLYQSEFGSQATGWDPSTLNAEVLVWKGYLWACRINGRDTVDCSGEGLYSLLRHRYIQTDLVYLSTGQATIARNLIAYTNGRAATLITLGSDAGANTGRSVAYCAWERRLVSEAIEELASADDGFDFEVTPAGVWNTYQPRKGADVSASVVFDQADVDLSNFAFASDATDLATEFTATGPCVECAGDTYTTVSGGVDATYGLHEASDHWDFRDHAHVAAAGREAYRNRKVPRDAASIRIPPDQNFGFGPCSLGDLVQLTASRGWLNVNQKMRVIGVSYDLIARQEWLKLDLDSVIA